MSVIMPGSYDPVTLGHSEIIRRVAEREDEVYAVVFNNPDKSYMFPLEDRVAMLMLALDDVDNVFVSFSSGYVVDYMRDHEIDRIVKGYRTDADLPWEHEQAEYNKKHGGYDTELIKCNDKYKNISSTLVRRAIKSGGDITSLVPESVKKYIDSMRNDGISPKGQENENKN